MSEQEVKYREISVEDAFNLVMCGSEDVQVRQIGHWARPSRLYERDCPWDEYYMYNKQNKYRVKVDA